MKLFNCWNTMYIIHSLKRDFPHSPLLYLYTSYFILHTLHFDPYIFVRFVVLYCAFYGSFDFCKCASRIFVVLIFLIVYLLLFWYIINIKKDYMKRIELNGWKQRLFLYIMKYKKTKMLILYYLSFLIDNRSFLLGKR